MDEDRAEEWARDSAESTVTREDELIWAWYRDPKTDLTQVEARDRAQHGRRYPQKYQIGQSSVSRKIGRLDDNMLTEPLLQLSMEQVPEDDRDEHDTAALLSRHDFQELKRWRFIAYLDAWRESLARFMCDMHALNRYNGEDISYSVATTQTSKIRRVRTVTMVKESPTPLQLNDEGISYPVATTSVVDNPVPRGRLQW